MKEIKIKHPFNKDSLPDEKVVLILGYFDGVHLGHQEVIKKGIEVAKERGLKAALMTFNRRPSIVYHKIPEEGYENLTQPEQKYKIIENLGIDILYEVFFNSTFGNLSPASFVEQYIVGLNAEVVVAGYDYTYGKPEIASMAHLPKYAKNRFEIIEVHEKKESGNTISSTSIRKLLKKGEIEKANAMLGYNYETLGFVIHGDARGRELGFPTANIHFHPYTLVPSPGIYAVFLTVHGKKYQGMASIGYNITFLDKADLSVEVNIFDFNEEIYGDDVSVEWVSYIRDEIKFSSVEELIEQLKEDETEARKLLNLKKV